MNKKLVATIDCTPTWMGLFPLYKEFILSGNEMQKQLVIDELEKLCKSMDKLNAEMKKFEGGNK